MKKIVMLVALVAFMAVSVVAFAAPAAPKGELTVTPAMKSDKKPAVKFKHETHKALTCKECHHTWDGNGDPKKCSECHTGRKDGKKPNSKIALHKNCKDCHKALKKAKKPTGPTSCKACHKK